jgi:FkbM family methyltransferase
MLVSERSISENGYPGLDRLLLKEAKGGTKKDKLVLFSLKKFYLASRAITRIFLGKKRSDDLYNERGINFKSFLYKSIKILGMDNLVLKINVPEYGYQAYCRSQNNFDDFVIMTTHEHDLIQHFTPKDGDVVVDIGAHIGLYTMISSKRVGLNARVVSVEADPTNFEMLNRNIKLNNLDNVVPLNYIAYSKEMDLELSEYSRMLSGGMIEESKGKDETVAIPVNTIDNLLQQNGITEVNWLKVDVEGAELEVLKGAHNTLSNSKDISILIEIHGISHLYKPIMDLLYSYNFRINFEKTIEGYQRQDMKGSKNIVLRKSI